MQGWALDTRLKRVCMVAGLRWLEMVVSRWWGQGSRTQDGGVKMAGLEMARLEVAGSRQWGLRWHK